MKKKIIRSLAICAALAMTATVGVYASENTKTEAKEGTVTEYTDVNAPSTYICHSYHIDTYQYREVCQDCGATLRTWTEEKKAETWS